MTPTTYRTSATDAELKSAMADKLIHYASAGHCATRSQMEAHFTPADLDRLGAAAAREAEARTERQTIARVPARRAA
ncbi:hypothetical protein [Rhizobium sp. NFR03]|uniref:hypothetical protein n=1 Tax=Rhizobium sp. NFR03 TaxID=1566263 RepID=UPI0008D69205|nr:hypothetical protein [Rhizobium sp. NFR03]SER58230.1 hypothetical protein SAMN03159406_00566 [Rhizobium sp. NFR03]